MSPPPPYAFIIPTKKCISENKTLLTWETSFMRERTHAPVFHAWETAHLQKISFGGNFVYVVSFSSLSILYEAIQWFDADGNFIFAADSQERNQATRDFVRNHGTFAISWKMMTYSNLACVWLESFSGMIRHVIKLTIVEQLLTAPVTMIILQMHPWRWILSCLKTDT